MIVKGSFEDFLYVMIGLVWVAFSIYKGNQKKKKSQNPDTEKKKGKSAIEELLGNFLDINQENEIVYQDEDIKTESEEALFDKVVVDEKTELKTTADIFSHNDSNRDSNFSQEKEVLSSDVNKNDRVFGKEYDIPVKKRKKSRFNVKKAVIYSEILNRPSY